MYSSKEGYPARGPDDKAGISAMSGTDCRAVFLFLYRCCSYSGREKQYYYRTGIFFRDFNVLTDFQNRENKQAQACGMYIGVCRGGSDESDG